MFHWWVHLYIKKLNSIVEFWTSRFCNLTYDVLFILYGFVLFTVKWPVQLLKMALRVMKLEQSGRRGREGAVTKLLQNKMMLLYWKRARIKHFTRYCCVYFLDYQFVLFMFDRESNSSFLFSKFFYYKWYIWFNVQF